VRAFLALKPREDAAPGEPQGAEGAAEPVAETGAAGTWRLWDSSGEPMAELLAGLARCKTAQDAPREARLLNKAGLTLCENGAPHEGLAYLQRAVASCRLFRDRRALLRTLGNLACAHLRLGGRGAALELLEESVELAQRLGDAPAEAGCLRKMALAHAADGDLDAGLRAIAEAVELFAGAGDRRGEAAARFTAAVMQYEAGAVVAGVVELERCLLVRRELKDKLGIAEVLSPPFPPVLTGHALSLPSY
jgi:tetratricopeptide (TPR) repeat protein